MTQSRFSIVSSALWLLAFICALFPIGDYDLEFFAGCIVLLFGWSFFLLARNVGEGWVVPKSPVLAFSALFFLLALASLFWSEIKPITLMVVCLFSALPLTFLTWSLRPDPKAFKLIAYSMVPVFIVLGLWAVVQYYTLKGYYYGQARFPLADPSSLGALFSLVFFAALGWMISPVSRAQKTIALVLSVIVFAGIVATVARGPVFAMVPALALFAVLLWPRLKASKGYLLALLAGAVIVTSVMHVTGHPDQKIANRVEETVAFTMRDGDVSNLRGYLWSATLDMIKDRPLLGTGFGTYYLYLPEYKNNAYTAPAYHAHADPLEFWAELGILGPVLFYAMLIAAAMRTLRALKAARPDQQGERIVVITVFAALTAMVIHTHVSFNLYNLSILMVSGVMLAAWFYATGRMMPDKTASVDFDKTPPLMAKTALALPYLFMAGLFLSMIGGEHYAGRALTNLFNKDMDKFVENINKAGQVSNYTNFRSYLFAVNVPLTLLQSGAASMDLAQRKALYDQAVGYMDNVLAINPRSETAYYYKARAQELAGPGVVPKDAPTREELYQKALQLNPMHLGARLALYRLAKANGESLYKQIEILEPAKDMYFNMPVAEEFYGELAILYLSTGNSVKSKEVMAKMVEFRKRSDFSRSVQGATVPGALMQVQGE